MTPRRQLPNHAAEGVSHAIRATFAIKAEMQSLLDVTAIISSNDEATAEDAWRALGHAVARAGTAINLAASAVRELEGIEGIEQEVDGAAMQLIHRPPRPASGGGGKS